MWNPVRGKMLEKLAQSRKRTMLSVQAMFLLLVIAVALTVTLGQRNLFAQSETTTPTGWIPPGDGGWWMGLACPHFDVPEQGPTWQTLTVGVSTVSHLESQLETMSHYNVSRRDFSETHYRVYYAQKYGVSDWEEQYAPNVVFACSMNDVITAMSVGWIPEYPTSPHLIDLVALYGVPDATTWTPRPTTRIVFWFDEGIAAEVFSGVPDRATPPFGNVITLVYFPYQNPLNYEDRWPYNATWPTVNDAWTGDYIPTEQNPFNFNAMLVTITAQPSRTPTPTFTPRPPQTATPTPKSMSTPN